jgi:1-acyl-sn-glycerol-3-phosphate acyltransferase
VNIWAHYIIATAGGKLTVSGLENVPKGENICFISNHQGMFDILIILAALPIRVGFIAKKSLIKFPVFAQWMMAIGSIFIDRSDVKNARESINKGIESIKKGNALVIFPEGTRSRGPKLGDFKKGSLKLALKSGATIIPISINGTYKMIEEHGALHSARMNLVIHKPIRPEEITPERAVNLMEEIKAIIATGMEDLSE